MIDELNIWSLKINKNTTPIFNLLFLEYVTDFRSFGYWGRSLMQLKSIIIRNLSQQWHLFPQLKNPSPSKISCKSYLTFILLWFLVTDCSILGHPVGSSEAFPDPLSHSSYRKELTIWTSGAQILKTRLRWSAPEKWSDSSSRSGLVKPTGNSTVKRTDQIYKIYSSKK